MTQWFNVEADYHQFTLSSPETDTTAVREIGSVFDTGAGFATFHTGIACGPVTVGIDLVQAPPQWSDSSEWDNVDEAVLAVTTPLRIITNAGKVQDEFEQIEVPPSGKLGIRGHVSGRAVAWDLVVEVPTEKFWIVMWPANEAGTKQLFQRRASDGLWTPESQQEEPESEIDISEDATARVSGPVRWNG
ncbi:hypothetical protein L1080_027905 [Rhodococcus sp. MSC1_016]|jgi:hypothetical protein|uniref:hypothetical protein n=1 Tax=Rhodococcus sp. MSC1_016 TaxID=2909266 RepID=UPI00202F208E|nr:hypothetical protein [Rhodococcus sp. MSC1_016]